MFPDILTNYNTDIDTTSDARRSFWYYLIRSTQNIFKKNIFFVQLSHNTTVHSYILRGQDKEKSVKIVA